MEEHTEQPDYDKPRYLTPRKARAYLDVSHTVLFQWELEGKIAPHFTPGGHRRYLKADLDRLLGEQPKTFNFFAAVTRAGIMKATEDMVKQAAAVFVRELLSRPDMLSNAGKLRMTLTVVDM